MAPKTSKFKLQLQSCLVGQNLDNSRLLSAYKQWDCYSVTSDYKNEWDCYSVTSDYRKEAAILHPNLKFDNVSFNIITKKF